MEICPAISCLYVTHNELYVPSGVHIVVTHFLAHQRALLAMFTSVHMRHWIEGVFLSSPSGASFDLHTSALRTERRSVSSASHENCVLGGEVQL